MMFLRSSLFLLTALVYTVKAQWCPASFFCQLDTSGGNCYGYCAAHGGVREIRTQEVCSEAQQPELSMCVCNDYTACHTALFNAPSYPNCNGPLTDSACSSYCKKDPYSDGAYAFEFFTTATESVYYCKCNSCSTMNTIFRRPRPTSPPTPPTIRYGFLFYSL